MQKPRYVTLWSLQVSLRQSAALLRIGSHLRIAGFSTTKTGISRIEKITVDSDKCSGANQGKYAGGLLIGAPVKVLNDRYADSIIEDRHHEFDGLEIHGVRDHHAPGDPNGTCCEVDNENPQFFSVYAHLKPTAEYGGVECVGDFATHSLAEQYAKELGAKYGWAIFDYVDTRFKTQLAA